MAQADNHNFKLRQESVVWRQVGDEVMVLDTASSEYLSINKTGSVLWHLLKDGANLEQLASALMEEFGIDTSQATTDALAFVSSVRELGLLEV